MDDIKKMKNVLITGHRGFIGSNLMKLIPEAIGYDLKDGEDILDDARLDAIIRVLQPEVIVHLAAAVSVEESRLQPEKYIQTNVIGTQKVLLAALKHGVKKFVYASSSACYEPNSTTYAMSKYVPEIMLDIAKEDIQTVALRFFNVYGEGSNPAYARAIDAFIEGANNGEINIYGDGDQTRDFIHVRDIARGLKAAVEKDIASGSVIDLGTGVATSINDLAAMIVKIMGKEVKIEHLLERKEVRDSCAGIWRAEELLDFKPLISLEQGLKELINGK